MHSDFLTRTVTRRQFAAGAVAGAATLALMPARSLFAAAQTTADLSSLGYPELNVTVTDTGFDGLPESTAAGRYLITVTGKTTKDVANLAFVSPTPIGMSAADLIQAIAGMAGPAAGDTSQSGGGQGGDQQIPLPFYQLYFAGGAVAWPGATAQAVVDLQPGDYMVWADDPEAAQQPVALQVTDDYPAGIEDAQADVTATLIDFAIGIEGSLTAGKHLLKIQHHGAQPHYLDIVKGPDTMTKEQIMATIKGEMNGAQAAGGIAESDLQPVFNAATQSIGTTTWHPIELAAGTYAAVCFFPTAGTGLPHAMEGMVEVFKVTR